MVKKLKITVEEMTESQQKATLVRTKNVQDIALIKEIILKMDVSKDITEINNLIEKELTKVELSINTVNNRITIEIERQNKEMAKIQERLAITEERIVEIGQDLRKTQDTVKHLQEIVTKIQTQQSTTKSETTKEVLKVVDLKMQETTKVIIAKHMKSIETRSEESITRLTKLVEKLQGRLVEEKEEREKSDAATTKLKIQVQELIGKRDDSESEKAVEELQDRVRRTEEMIEKESLERKKSEAGIESMKEVIKVIQLRIESESSSIRVLETRIKEILNTQQETSKKIEKLRKEAEESSKKLEKTIETVRDDMEKEEELRKKSDEALVQLTIFVQQISVTIQSNSKAIRKLRRDLKSETTDLKEEVNDIESKLKVLTEGLSNAAHKAGAPCPDGCEDAEAQQPKKEVEKQSLAKPATRGFTNVVAKPLTVSKTPVTPKEVEFTLAGDTGCLKNGGPHQRLIRNARSHCARFRLSGRQFYSLDQNSRGQCLDYFRGSKAWGIYKCHHSSVDPKVDWNQQFTKRGLNKWCVGTSWTLCVLDIQPISKKSSSSALQQIAVKGNSSKGGVRTQKKGGAALRRRRRVL